MDPKSFFFFFFFFSFPPPSVMSMAMVAGDPAGQSLLLTLTLTLTLTPILSAIPRFFFFKDPSCNQIMASVSHLPWGQFFLSSSSSQRSFLFLLLNLHALFFFLISISIPIEYRSSSSFFVCFVQSQSRSSFIDPFSFYFIFLGFLAGIAGISSTAMYRKNSYERQVKLLTVYSSKILPILL